MKKNSLIQYVVYISIALLIFFLIAMYRGLFSAPDARSALGVIADSLTIPGILMAGLGALSWASSKGAYDAFGYAFSHFSLHSLFPNAQSRKRPESLYDYVQEKNEKGRGWSPPLLVVGLSALLLSLIACLLYLIQAS